jgi:hypothetical protein
MTGIGNVNAVITPHIQLQVLRDSSTAFFAVKVLAAEPTAMETATPR